MNLTVLAEKRCKGLFDVVITDILGKGTYGFDISPYSFSFDDSTLSVPLPSEGTDSGEHLLSCLRFLFLIYMICYYDSKEGNKEKRKSKEDTHKPLKQRTTLHSHLPTTTHPKGREK